jgi:triosephosphate isomerase
MKPLIVANWKMNPTSQKEAKELFDSLKRGLRNIKKTEVVVCPPFVYLLNLKSKILNLKLGAQDCFWELGGAFTGEISPSMLKDLGVKYVIIGHSERRKILQETDEMIAKKLKAVLKLKLCPIFCVGETQKEREKGETFKTLEREIKNGLKKIPKSQIEKIVIAYEPIWAIGTKNPCRADDALTCALFIRKVISRISYKKTARKIRILYGGSVDSQNAKDYLKNQQINGLLVGGASLNPKEFLKIVKVAESS